MESAIDQLFPATATVEDGQLVLGGISAAELAREAGVRLLALTHVSPRYFGPELLREAREIFPATVLPRDFDTIEVPFAERGEPLKVLHPSALHCGF